MLSNLPVQVDVVVVGAVVIVCVDVIVWAVGDGHLEQLARTVSLVGWLADCEGHLDFVAGVGAAWVEGCRKDGNAAGEHVEMLVGIVVELLCELVELV